MAARKKLVSTVCIISLILAITAGVLLSAGAQSGNGAYVGSTANIVNTGAVSINAGTMTSANGADKPADAPADAVAINDQSSLGTFLDGGASYGYLTADFDLNWSGTGTDKALAEGRTIDGNGHAVTLKDDDGDANQYRDQLGTHIDFTGGMDYGMFVAYNAGTIKNVKFRFDSGSGKLTIKNDRNNIVPNYAGLVCGTNAPTGVISNCDLDANGAIKYEFGYGTLNIEAYDSGDRLVRKAFSLCFGGIAGRNAGLITNVKTNYTGTTNVGGYQCFDISLNVTAANSTKGAVVTWQQRADARAFCGGISGTMYSANSEISNIILTGNVAMYMATESHQNTGTSERAHSCAIGAAVVGANSSYSEAEGGIGGGASSQGTVDNIIQGLNVRYNNYLGFSPNANSGNPTPKFPDEYSDNATVFCGKATNVTLIRDSIDGKIVNGQKVHYQTDHCNCGVGTNAGQHDAGYSNLVYADAHSDITVDMQAEFDETGNPVLNGKDRQVYKQVIKVTPNDVNNYMLGEFKFTKHMGRNEDAEGDRMQSSKGEDVGSSGPKNDTAYLYAMQDVRQDSYTFKVEPYQASPARYWETYAYDYAIADISEADATLAPATDTMMDWATQYVYNGFDFLTRQLKYTSKDGSKTGLVDPAGFNAISSDANGTPVTSGRLPGEYSFTLQEKQYGLSYFNKEQRIVTFADDTENLAPFTFKVVNAGLQIQGFTIEEISNENHWFNEVTDFNYEIVTQKVQEGAVNGYVYEVNGSTYNRSGLTMSNDTSTSTAGRTYTVYLTSGGVQVTDPITYTVRVDLENPTLKIPQYEHADGRYYTHNRVSIDAQDEHSGVASIMMYNYDAAGNSIGDPVDVIFECRDNSEENDLSYIDNETGYYVWYFTNSGRIVIEVTDFAGLKTQRELNVNIDNFTPTITVDAYFYDIIEGADGGATTRKTAYESGYDVYSAVYFSATAQFGESGGEIQYSYDNEKWFTYTDTLVVKEMDKDVYIRAMSNTFDHKDAYPYKKMYQVHTYWDKNETVDSHNALVTVPFKVNADVDKVVVTNDDILIGITEKVFDGTTYFDVANIQAKSTLEAKVEGRVVFKAEYLDVNASDSVAIRITADCPDDNTKVFDNQIEDVIGSITKREISVKIDSKEKYFGYALPELTYKAENMIEDFEEKIELYVDKGDFAEYTYELLPQSKRDDTNNGYVITVAEGQTFNNYTLPASNVATGILQIDLAPIDRLVYKQGEFTGLDTVNIATRNLEIGFMRVTGDYQKLDVKFERRVYDDSTGSLITKWVLQKDIKTAPAGFYKVTLSLPERTTIGNRITADMYELDPSIATFMFKVIDASKFIVDEEAPQTVDNDKSAQVAPVLSKDSAKPSDYEGNAASTDNTGAEIESTAKKTKDYLAMVSIFCAVIMVIAFAIGVGKAVMKRRAKR